MTSVLPKGAPATTPQPTPAVALDRQRWQRRYATVLRWADALVICGAVIVAQSVRFGNPPLVPGEEGHQHATLASALIVVIWLVSLAGFRARCSRIMGRGTEEYRRAVEATLWTFGAIAMAELLFKLDIARGYLAVALPTGVLGLVANRWLARRWVARGRREGKYQTAVLAVGNVDAVIDLADELSRRPEDGFRITGACVPGAAGVAVGTDLHSRRGVAIPVVGCHGDDLTTIVTHCGADTVAVVGAGHLGVRELRRLMWELEPLGVELVVSPGVTDVAASRVTMLPIAGFPLLHIDKPQYRGAERLQKRVFDFCFALAALTVTLPVLVTAAVLVKATSKGPVFYASERIGFNGCTFRMLKLRTMVQDADKLLVDLMDSNECDGNLFKMRDDPRVTPVGRILRRFSIDELPQFINVLRREMSVVGPRPLFTVRDTDDLDAHRRLLVKPGITGLWQVSGRSDLSWEDSIRLDLSYVDNWSMAADIVIITKTVRSVLAPSGAY